MIRTLTLLLLLTFSLSAEEKKSTDQFRKISEKTLEETWQALLKHHYDSNSSKEWQEIYETSRPEILKSRNNREIALSINKMLSRLGQSHIHLLPPVSRSVKKAIVFQKKSRDTKPNESKSTPEKIDNPEVKKESSNIHKGKAADPGLRLCVADDKICILEVCKASPAGDAGLRIGDVVSEIYGLKFDLSQYSDCPWDVIAEGMLMGNYGTSVPLTVVDREGNSRKISLKRKSLYGPWIKMGVMPKIAGKVEHKILEGNIGYIYLTPCFPQQIIKMQKLLSNELKDCKALIVDVRNNPGGMMFMAQGMAGWISDQQLEMGTMKTREFPLQLKSSPQESAFTGPLAVIVNKGTFSTAEVFAAGMQDNKRAKVFGETTGGQCLPSIFLALSTGFRLQTIFGDFERMNGERIEKKGVVPDFKVKQKHEDLRSGIDTACEAARKYLLQEK